MALGSRLHRWMIGLELFGAKCMGCDDHRRNAKMSLSLCVYILLKYVWRWLEFLLISTIVRWLTRRWQARHPTTTDFHLDKWFINNKFGAEYSVHRLIVCTYHNGLYDSARLTFPRRVPANCDESHTHDSQFHEKCERARGEMRTPMPTAIRHFRLMGTVN